MLIEIIKNIKIAVSMLIVMILLTGIAYPAIVTLLAAQLFPWRANGSLIVQDGRIIGSELIGQTFIKDKYFWPRPSSTQPFPFTADASTGSNYAATNPDYLANIQLRIDTLHQVDPTNMTVIPAGFLTSSASGLDPEVSPEAAFYQVHRVARARHMTDIQLSLLIQEFTQKRWLNLYGEPRVNVLRLNLALDSLDQG